MFCLDFLGVSYLGGGLKIRRHADSKYIEGIVGSCITTTMVDAPGNGFTHIIMPRLLQTLVVLIN